ncbi:MAG TPA: inositol monophosphatase family protein [Beijerinckiaceae bacterium]|nr:inositol monophosphatase family protein [Beijerinckiaceae bacterium]
MSDPLLPSSQLSRLRDILVRAAVAGGEAAMPFYRPAARTTATIGYKASQSPVTEADYAADAAIRAALTEALPEAAIFSEEAAKGEARFSRRQVAVVDPIDGTRAFIAGRSEWCVSVALLDDGRPVAGVIHAPARGETFAAAARLGATLNGRILSRPVPSGGAMRITGPMHLIDQLDEHWPDLVGGETLKALAYRLVTVTDGRHDIAVASTGAHDWDIAAAAVILAEAGCTLLTFSGERPVYNAAIPVHPALLAAEAGTAHRLAGLLAAAGSSA